jgi:hypothetical protein
MKRKNKLPLSTHKKIAEHIRRGMYLWVEAANAYPQKSKEHRAFAKYEKAAKELKNIMDNACFREHPNSGEVYYGGGLEDAPISEAPQP